MAWLKRAQAPRQLQPYQPSPTNSEKVQDECLKRARAPPTSLTARPPLGRRESTSKRSPTHPYLSGNFAPVSTEYPLTDCLYQGTIPSELAGCQYVRNGGNPMANSDADRDAHWFDADGMLAGVLFRRLPDGSIQPSFLNRYILTDLILSTPDQLRRPILPSIATLVNPGTSLLWLLVQILRSFLLIMLSWLPGLGLRSEHKVRRISVANTSIYWHDGKAMAGCESGPPIRIILPGLETGDWWTGEDQDGGGEADRVEDNQHLHEVDKGWGSRIPVVGMLREFTTAHPKVDPVTGELLLYHMTFVPPHLRISVFPGSSVAKDGAERRVKAIKGVAVPGLSQPKMMHDFAASSSQTVVLDLPLSLDPVNVLKGRPILHYDPTKASRFGVFPRRSPASVKWYESPEACCVYHTANCWDEYQDENEGEMGKRSSRLAAVNMLGCRLNSATLVYSAGNLVPPNHALPPGNAPEKCQLYYWRFSDPPSDSSSAEERDGEATISHEFALSEVPFEFPSMNEAYSMSEARFVYGTSLKDGTFDAGLGKAAKIDCLVKMDVGRLIQKGRRLWSAGQLERGGSVDRRTVEMILEDQRCGITNDAIRIFEMPSGWYAQEATFVARRKDLGEGAEAEEDDGWLLCYVFDENSGLHPTTGDVLPGATSELWIIDAKRMDEVVCRIKLPQRVPYGLHGTLFSEEQIASQRPIEAERVRSWARSINKQDPMRRYGVKERSWTNLVEAFLADPIRVMAWEVKRGLEGLIA
ncbi:carotenoid oxygenase [Violaceomyces palustris]|uniref:Carotenoid oxygenase n=1 Tax=Violaceomyces palustris TaxID=1673888 RepID=A0ACD0NZJ2_9BASI|nr:carotenoid oxygenase [Violaceomyces palustris]